MIATPALKQILTGAPHYPKYFPTIGQFYDKTWIGDKAFQAILCGENGDLEITNMTKPLSENHQQIADTKFSGFLRQVEDLRYGCVVTERKELRVKGVSCTLSDGSMLGWQFWRILNLKNCEMIALPTSTTNFTESMIFLTNKDTGKVFAFINPYRGRWNFEKSIIETI
jgi:hypothetical protein